MIRDLYESLLIWWHKRRKYKNLRNKVMTPLNKNEDEDEDEGN